SKQKEISQGDVEENKKYQFDDPITLWVNKVGPYNNPQETYNYYSLPFCQPGENPTHRWGGLGEVLGGNELIDRNVYEGSICSLELDASKVKQFEDAIASSYWFELFIDDLPLWAFVGETDKTDQSKHYLFTHKSIIVGHSENQIIHANLTQGKPVLLEPGKTLDMTYSVNWFPTNVTFARRFDVYLDYPFFEHQIHWFSIFNSFMMVIFLTGLVSMILMRTLRNDYAKYAREDDDLDNLERDVNEESGWKLVHGDVFRPPCNLVFLSALVGTGAQLSMLILLVIVLAIIGMLYVGQKKLDQNNDSHNILFPFLCFGWICSLNTIAIFYRSLAAIPFGTMVVVFVIWAFISFPLALLGTVAGRNWVVL
ncbi:hypothetical protein HPP92_028061, partial [Vanilla planifolia]